jgi:hypothetical protein
MLKISTFQDQSADFTQQVELDGQLVQIRIVYNVRNDRFTLHTFTDQDENSVYGIKIVPFYLLLDFRKGFLDFEGDLIVLKSNIEVEDDITYDNFGNGWDLYYMTPTEVSEWKEANGF